MITVTHRFDCGEGTVLDVKLSDGDEDKFKKGTIAALIESGNDMLEYLKGLGAPSIKRKIIINLDAEPGEEEPEDDSNSFEVSGYGCALGRV